MRTVRTIVILLASSLCAGPLACEGDSGARPFPIRPGDGSQPSPDVASDSRTDTKPPDAGRECTRETNDESDVEGGGCNGRDDDCDGVVDESCPCDFNGQSEGICGRAERDVDTGECGRPVGYQSDETRCDSIDNDCDGRTDEGLDCPETHVWSSDDMREASDVAVADGRAYVAIGGGDVDVPRIAALDFRGNEKWETRLRPEGQGQVCAVAADSNAIFAAGPFHPHTPPRVGAPAIAKLRPNGEPVWYKRFGDYGTHYGFPSLSAAALDSSGNLVVVGTIHPERSDSGGVVSVAMKFDRSGRRLWKTRLSPPLDQRDTPATCEVPSAVATTASGPRVLAPVGVEAQADGEIDLVALNPSGKEQWRHAVDVSGYVEEPAIEAAGGGRVAVLQPRFGNGADLELFDATGSREWKTDLSFRSRAIPRSMKPYTDYRALAAVDRGILVFAGLESGHEPSITSVYRVGKGGDVETTDFLGTPAREYPVAAEKTAMDSILLLRNLKGWYNFRDREEPGFDWGVGLTILDRN